MPHNILDEALNDAENYDLEPPPSQQLQQNASTSFSEPVEQARTSTNNEPFERMINFFKFLILIYVFRIGINFTFV